MKKKIILIVIGAIVASSFIFFWFSQKNNPNLPNSAPNDFEKCGDGICDEIEKANWGACPEDCSKKSSVIPDSSTREDSPFGLHTGVPFDEAEKIGAKWTRGGNFPYLFWAMVDPQKTGDPEKFQWKGETKSPDGKPGSFNYDPIADVSKADLSMVLNIQPEPAPWGFSKTDSWAPADEIAYRSFVKEAVKRYSFVKYWQVGNEPNLEKNSPDDFEELQRITYEAIKEANPEAQVIMGGVAGNSGINDMNDDYFEPVLAALNGKYVDVFDVHFYGDAKGGKSNTEKGRLLGYQDFKTVHSYFRSLLDKNGFSETPIWVTEMGTFSGKWAMTGLEQTEREQAVDLVKRYVFPLSLGVKKVFWAMALVEGFGAWDDDFFDHTGLIYRGRNGLGEKKLGYYAFKLMTEKLEGSVWNNIETLEAGGGVYAFKFTKNGKNIWVAWNDNDAEKQLTISGINSSRVETTEAVPKYEAGGKVSDYGNAFNKKIEIAQSGKISLTLGKTPLFIEEN